MKFFLFALALSLPSVANETDVERKAIEKTIGYYFAGGTENLNRAFHPQATLKYVRDGKHNLIPIPEFIERVGKKPTPKRKTQIDSIDYTGTAGMARVSLIYDDFTFVDYFSMLKVEGEWKIVTKISMRVYHDTK